MGICQYVVYRMEHPFDPEKPREVNFTPIHCDEQATQTITRRSHKYENLRGPIDVCNTHAKDVEKQNNLDDAVAEGSLGREIYSQTEHRCLCSGHEHVGEHCPRPCGCAHAPESDH